ncbi:MAG: hypothetical protein ACLP5V_13555 [Candidatus Bathyarchaeia archaeon]
MKDVLIGDNAFIGVSHLSQDRARERLKELHLETINRMFETALSCGATGFSFTVHPTNLQILHALDKAGTTCNLGLYPILPYAAGYVRTVNEKGVGGLINDFMSRYSLSDKAKLSLRAGFSALALDPTGMMRTYVDAELLPIVRLGGKLATILLHDVVTDLAVSFQSRNLIDSYMQHVRDKYHVKPGFDTRNFVRFVKFFRDVNLPLEDTIIMTPFNKIGFQMNPSREACEACLSELHGPSLIAMSILAGGYLTLEEAVGYIRQQNLSGAVVGVSSEEHAQHVFTKLREIAEPAKTKA